MKQKAQITYEQRETVVLKQSGSHLLDRCPRCDETVMLVTPEILAAMTGSSEREIFRLVEAGVIHFIERTRIYACPECFRNSIAPALLEEGHDSATVKLGELK